MKAPKDSRLKFAKEFLRKQIKHFLSSLLPKAATGRVFSGIAIFFMCTLLFLPSPGMSEEPYLTVLCGAAFSKPFDEIATSFQRERGIKVYITYASVPSLLAQLKLGRRGDILVTPTQDLMVRAMETGLVVASSVRIFAYMVPVIAVQKGNPRRIKGIHDLAGKGIRIALADPEAVYIGNLAAEIMEKNLSGEELKKARSNVVTYMEDFSKLTTTLILKQVDAIISFHYLQQWHPEKIEIIKLKPKEVQRIGVGQAAIISYSQIKVAAQAFLEFLNSKEAKIIFTKYQYFNSPEETGQWIGARKPIGGEYKISPDWMRR